MLTFLRKIRKSLIESGSAKKPASPAGRYLLYAIGEIALVVLGILIALQINNWNQERLDIKKAIQYHQRLIEDLDFVIERNEVSNLHSIKVMNSMSKTLEMLEKGKIDSDEEKSVFDYTMIMYYRLSRQILYISTWEEMKSNGDMNLIFNLKLRKDINALQSLINLAHEVSSKHASSIRNDMAFYSKHTRTYVNRETLEETVISNFDAMVADPQFINQFSSNIASWKSSATFAKNIIDRAVDLKIQLQNELKSMSQ